MAKKSSINKNAKRTKMAKQMGPKRARLKAVASDRNAPEEDRFAAQLKLAEIPRNSSKTGRRYYSKVTDMPRIYNRLGIAILSTPNGVMSDNEARAANVGGEILCRVF